MRSVAGNPQSNALGAGVTEALIKKAVESSGYPLQLVVAKALRQQSFSIQEEWSYVDSDSGDIRTIDIVASKPLYEWREPQPRIRPAVSFVVECKQSDLPFVFFLSGSQPWVPDFPMICGLKSNNIVITSDDDPSTWNYSPLHVLELDQHTFLTQSTSFCTTFSKCTRKGSDLILSGSDAYQSIVFPILKAVSHYHKTHCPPVTAYYFDCHLTIGIGILDAPMIGIHVSDSGNDMEFMPWVRLVRYQPHDGEHSFRGSKVYAIDIIHRDFLEIYVRDYALPFADEFARLALKHAAVLADTRGFVPQMGKDSWVDIEARLQPAGFKTVQKRGVAILNRLIRLFKGGRNE